MTHTAPMGAPSDLAACPLMPNYGAPSIMFMKGRGTELWDRDGKRYLDFVGGLAVQALGHAHPEVADAIAEQAGKLVQVSNLWATEHAHEVAQTLDRLLGGGGQVFFCNSGAEANEFAFKLARKWAGHGRYGVVSTFGSFHGRTLAALAACGQPNKHEPFAPMPEGFKPVERDDIEALENALDPNSAAIHLEPVQGEGGVWPAAQEFMEAARRLADERNLLFSLDEVQSGLCRTGKWFAIEHYGLQPDVVCLAKALGNGFPIAAVWAKSEVAACLVAGDHGSTYGGNALATAAARKVLEIMEREDLPSKAAELGKQLTAGLMQLPRVTGVRGMGGMLAAELDGEVSKDVAAKASDAGLLVNAITPTALRFTPPLTTSQSEVDEAMGILHGALS
jgi:acetylornithine/N-succinyldiaminopimelate aminotransferase